jgi:hypothetical protein
MLVATSSPYSKATVSERFPANIAGDRLKYTFSLPPCWMTRGLNSWLWSSAKRRPATPSC